MSYPAGCTQDALDRAIENDPTESEPTCRFCGSVEIGEHETKPGIWCHDCGFQLADGKPVVIICAECNQPITDGDWMDHRFGCSLANHFWSETGDRDHGPEDEY